MSAPSIHLWKHCLGDSCFKMKMRSMSKRIAGDVQVVQQKTIFLDCPRLPSKSTFVFVLLLTASASAVQAHGDIPEGWRCDPELFRDIPCDCGCGAVDDECEDGTIHSCERNQCAEGYVPLTNKPQTCAESRCGDGWLDESIGEVCDNGGQDNEGCSMGCTEIDEGWQCGRQASGCWRVQDGETPPSANDQYLGETEDQHTTTGDAEVLTTVDAMMHSTMRSSPPQSSTSGCVQSSSTPIHFVNITTLLLLLTTLLGLRRQH